MSPTCQRYVVNDENASLFRGRNARPDFQRSVLNPETVPTDALDRVYGRPERLAMEENGNVNVLP